MHPFVLRPRAFDPDQPRDDHGRWSSGGGAPEREAPADLLKRLASSPTHQAWVSGVHAGKPPVETLGSSQLDRFHEALLRERGQDAAPRVADAAEVDQVVAGGGTELFRGVEKPEHAEEFRAGESHSRAGIHGSGVYCARVNPEAAPGSYGSKSARRRKQWAERLTTLYAQKDGAIIRMALPKDAKVVDDTALKSEHGAFMRHLLVQQAKAAVGGIVSASSRVRYRALGRARELYADAGRFATARGYDAISVPKKDYLVLLNRSGAVAQADNHPPVREVL